ncbi:recombinase family protein [Salinithrix halophila]|uniref:Recombinase family protein n=1 Tax=Salinithrix halophila TaxID=1485204 RepID=A0ABV8JK96_9BACL
MDRVAVYLRKSRADMEAEARGEGETLRKHRKTLLSLAKKQGFNIVRIREEIASGESLIHRPEMMALLKEVETGIYDGVLVMDMDRLGRGNMQEQGLILDTLRRSGTKIVTPRKVYDLQDEWDEEYSEFEAFMARKELKLITRRLQSGRRRSLEDGNWIASTAPYGYRIIKDDRGHTLEPIEEEANAVRLIFKWYTSTESERAGTYRIAERLNEMGIKPRRSREWMGNLVLNIIKKSPVYAGYIQWGKVDYQKVAEGRKQTRTKPQEEWVEVKGRHTPLIDRETADKAMDILERRTHPPYRQLQGIKNPLAGVVKCGKCGRSMVRQDSQKQKPHLLCINKQCNNKSTRFDYVESRLLNVLGDWLKEYRLQWEPESREQKDDLSEITAREQAIKSLEKELTELEGQRERLHDLLERGIYDDETFMERSTRLAARISDTRTAIKRAKEDKAKAEEQSKARSNVIPQVEHVLGLYPKTFDPKQKNILLKSILERVEYTKEPNQVKDQFTLDVFPKLD